MECDCVTMSIDGVADTSISTINEELVIPVSHKQVSIAIVMTKTLA